VVLVPQNLIFLVALLVIMAAMVIFTFVFITLVDRSTGGQNDSQEPEEDSTNEESA
jgi:cobalamin synthase